MNETLQSQHSDAPSTFLLQTTTLTSAFLYPIVQRLDPYNTAAPSHTLLRSLTTSLIPRLTQRAMSATSSSVSAATMPTTEGDQHCHLLDLPVEMLQRITENLHATQVLPALRLTCKALDSITFDRFAQTFDTVRCCIFYEERWLSLQRLLGKPSRIMNRIRWVEFTTCFFEHVDFRKVPLALNHNDGVPAINGNFRTYTESQAAAVQGRPINVALIGRVLRDLKRVFPHIEISYRMSDNQSIGFEHLRTQRDILLTMLITTHHKIRHLSLSHSTVLALDNIMDHLRPELLHSVSKLRGFRFMPPRGCDTSLTRRGATSHELRVRVMYKVLQSAKDLRHLELSLDKFSLLGHASTIARVALESAVSKNIQRFVFRSAKITEEDLLKALSRWAPKLEELELGEVCLSFVREGRSTILQLIATMPKLKHLVLWEMGEKRGLRNSDMVSISMNHLKKGRKNTLTERTLLGRQAGDRLGRHYSGRDEVLSGLEELLAERLRYHQRTMFA